MTRIADRGGEFFGQSQAPLGCGQKHDAAIRSDAPAIERSGDFLASDGWKRKRRQSIFGHGGCGSREVVGRTGFDNRILRYINRLSYIRQPIRRVVVNKTG
jgi:hypothetical protein